MLNLQSFQNISQWLQSFKIFKLYMFYSLNLSGKTILIDRDTIWRNTWGSWCCYSWFSSCSWSSCFYKDKLLVYNFEVNISSVNWCSPLRGCNQLKEVGQFLRINYLLFNNIKFNIFYIHSCKDLVVFTVCSWLWYN